MYVKEFFFLAEQHVEFLEAMIPKFGYDGFGEIAFYRTYSRLKNDGRDQENWCDVVIRVINGVMTIRKDWYIRNFIRWDEAYWQAYAYHMAVALFKMEWMPAGRGLWAMGTQFVYERGSMALNNCSYSKLGCNDRLSDDLEWVMDALMLGCGVGFSPVRDDLKVYQPNGTYVHYVPDTREGWTHSWKLLIDAFIQPGYRLPVMKYDLVRPAGTPIRGFGGIASGPGHLQVLHEDTVKLFQAYASGKIDVVRLKTDLANKCGVCVVAGNVRRSAEIALGEVTDSVFMDLKDYSKNPDREDFGGLSNNTVKLYEDEHFDMLGEVARRVTVRGEPGVANILNFRQGRIGKKIPVREDKADGLNPCLRASSLLLTPNGIRPLSQVDVGDSIWSKSGWTKVVNKWSTGMNYVFNFRTPEATFSGTAKHRVLFKGQKIEVKDAPGIDTIRGPLNVSSHLYSDVEMEAGRKQSLGDPVPEEYFYGSEEKVSKFLSGFFGNKDKLWISSFTLMTQLQIMLSSIGIGSRYVKHEPYYELQIFSEQDEQSSPIIEIEELGKEETWDITVDNESHTYWTQGCNVSNCGEIPLEDKELCNLVETVPTMCPNVNVWYKACEYATLYASTVSLLPTHSEATNRVVARNRRIGVGIIDWTGWVHAHGLHKVTKWMREGYEVVTRTNQEANAEAGVPEAIRKTTIKPGGTTPKLPGKTSGVGYPTFRETLRRIRVPTNSHTFVKILDEAGIPYEPCYFDPKGTRVYEYPTKQGPVPPADEISLWEQAANLVTVQREWADNAVSNTLYFRPKWKLVCFRTGKKYDFEEEVSEYGQLASYMAFHNSVSAYEYRVETSKIRITITKNKYDSWELKIYEFDPNHEENIIEKVLASIVPLIKTCSLLPHSAKGAYRQMPEEGISAQEYQTRLDAIKPIDWTTFRGSDGIDEKYCQGDTCTLPGA